jgi:nucleoside-triphosphatase THEP1
MGRWECSRAGPARGKSTVARRLADRLGEEGIPVSGFVTEEIRESGRRIELLRVTTANRNELPDLLAARLRTAR